jgi:Asp/Glu/hydantoin racemase
MIKVFAIHTATALVEPITTLFKENLPHIKLNHVADDSLIQDVIAAGEVTLAVRKRLINYYFAAVDGGADVIFNTCSSVGEIAEYARELIPIPILRIDDPMAIKAVQSATKIGVVATLPTTLSPTCNLVRKKAALEGKNINIVEGLAEGAFQAAMSGNRDKHDKLILEAALKIAPQVDTIVLAQGSMARMEEKLAKETGKIVLSSPYLGVMGVKEYLASM